MFDGSLDINPTDVIMRDKGLGLKNAVQSFVDTEVMRYMGDYMPRRQSGELEHMMTMATVVGSGQIDIPGPYAHYLHEGIVYVDPIFKTAGFKIKTGPYAGEWRSRKGVTKVMSSPVRELQFFGAPMRGKKFFDRMKADHKEDILKSTQALIDRGGT
jgi:hypothetical protein